jgi:hypothetical protein
VSVARPITAERLAGLARELRTNTTLSHLELNDAEEDPHRTNRPNPYRPIEEVLEAYNFMLQEVDVVQGFSDHREAQARMDRLLCRNRGIKSALEALQRLVVRRGAQGQGSTVSSRSITVSSRSTVSSSYSYRRSSHRACWRRGEESRPFCTDPCATARIPSPTAMSANHWSCSCSRCFWPGRGVEQPPHPAAPLSCAGEVA